MPALGRIGIFSAGTAACTAAVLYAGGGFVPPGEAAPAPPEWSMVQEALPAGSPVRVLVLALAFGALWGTVVGIVALRHRHARESLGWRIAVSMFGIGGFLLGQVSGLWWMQAGAGAVVDGLGTRAHALDLAVVVREGSARILLGCAAGAAGALGTWLLAWVRHREKRIRSFTTSEDPGAFAG
jgi:hypothetical protein